jgi:hypothetical protein
VSGDEIHRATYGRVPTGLLFSALPDRAKVLYGVLTRYADQFNRAFPSRRRLAENLHCSTDSVDRAIRTLEAKGWLRVEHQDSEHGDPDTNRYSLLNPDPTQDSEGVAARLRPRVAAPVRT